MSYKFTTGSVRRGDIYFEDDRTGDLTYIDFNDDSIGLKAGATSYTADANAGAWKRHWFEGGGIYVDGNNLYFDNDKGLRWGDSSVLLEGDGTTEQLIIKANSTTYFFLTGSATSGETGMIGVGTATPTATLHISGSDSTNLFGIRSDSNIDLFVVTGSGKVGVGVPDPKVALDVHDDPTALSNDTGGGTVVKFGTDAALTAGKVYYFHTNGVWTETDADAVATGADQLLGISLGTDATIHGILVQGFFDATTYLSNFSTGKAIYLSTTAASMDTTAPAGAGDFVRVVGYCTDTANVIYFNPGSTWVEL